MQYSKFENTKELDIHQLAFETLDIKDKISALQRNIIRASQIFL